MKKSQKTLFRKKQFFGKKNFFFGEKKIFEFFFSKKKIFLEKKNFRIFLQKKFFVAKNFVRMSFAKSWSVVETINTFGSEEKEHKCENLEKKVKCLTRYKIGRSRSRRRRRRGSFFFCSFFFSPTQFPRLRSAFGLATLGINSKANILVLFFFLFFRSL